jgi:DNA-binding CsgD family transcriptional regulator
MRLTERLPEQRALLDIYSEVRVGHGSVVVIDGSVGGGKSSLLNDFAQQVREDSTYAGVLAAHAERRHPLGTLHQIFDALPADADCRRQLTELLARAADSMATCHHTHTLDPAMAAVMRQLWSILQDLATRAPVVITVDDAQCTDAPSMQSLLFFARRLATARILIVLTHNQTDSATASLLRTDLGVLPHCRHLVLEPLSRRGIGELILDQVGVDDATAARLVPQVHSATGGNPALTVAMIADMARAAGRRNRLRVARGGGVEPASDGTAEVVADEFYRLAVLSTVRHCGPSAQRTAVALALLDGAATAHRLSRFTETDPVEIGNALQVLAAAGLLHEQRFRHRAARTVLLENLPAETRAELHRRAAQVLHADGADAETVAEHLMHTGEDGPSWVIPALEEAADRSLDAGATEQAVKLLRRAAELIHDEDHLTTLATKLVSLEWRLDPQTAARHLPVLIDAHRQGRMDGLDVSRLIGTLLWNGEFAAVKEMLEVAGPDMTPDGDHTHLRVAHYRLKHTYPTLLPSLRTAPSPDIRHRHIPQNELAAAVLATTVTEGGGPVTNGQAERILLTTPLDDNTADTVQAALLTLLYGNETRLARTLADRAVETGRDRLSPAWMAVLLAIRAEVGIREGDLQSAGADAEAALRRLPPSGWGVALAAPMACLVTAKTWTSSSHEAARLLDHEIPDATFRTRFALPYLYARGTYHLVIERPEAALGDFLACGELMSRWNQDIPGLVPWRTGAAQAHLKLEQPEVARRLALQQLELPDVKGTRAEALSHKVIALAGDRPDRPAGLRRSIRLFQSAGDRLGAACALTELSHSLQEIDQCDQAAEAADRARELAVTGHLVPLLRLLEGIDVGATQSAAGPHGVLTGAELRVARLAAAGHTNRQIAEGLCVTTSTVEQHLTNIFRKMKIKRRTQLTVLIQDIPVDWADGRPAAS